MYWTDVRFCTGLLMEEVFLRLGSSVFLDAFSGISEAKTCSSIVTVVFGDQEQHECKYQGFKTYHTLQNVHLLHY